MEEFRTLAVALKT